HGAVNTLATTGLLFALFTSWSINLHRTPLAEVAGLDTRPASDRDLTTLCERLVERANLARAEVHENESDGTMRLNDAPGQALARTWLAFHRAEQLHRPLFRGRVGRVKRLTVLSEPATRLGFGGLYLAVTGEPTVSASLPPAGLPFAACHQLGHQVGWAGEADASFAGWLACTSHPDADFRYAAHLAALDGAMDALLAIDPSAWRPLIERVTPEVRNDWRTLDRIGVGCPQLDLPTTGRPSSWIDLLLAHERREAAVREASLR
ncbi:MAG TPA: DUF3810 family protein, partial [Candidatus Polarisedimenticolaceae bacterium]|nr:DUF3810 family protein [Candidatus Polarisedimenticolaceae bacterium]